MGRPFRGLGGGTAATLGRAFDTSVSDPRAEGPKVRQAVTPDNPGVTSSPDSLAVLSPPPSPWRLSVAPMLDWTDRHCRHFHRQLTRQTRLYTEMVTTGALRFGDQARHLDYGAEEHPLALQLGGSEPEELAHATRLARQWGYDEVNLNCGCPSERVQRGAFGACLMAEAPLVADCVRAVEETAPAQVGSYAERALSRLRDHYVANPMMYVDDTTPIGRERADKARALAVDGLEIDVSPVLSLAPKIY